MQHAAEALDQRIGELALEKGGKVGALGPARSDRADQRAFRPGRKALHLFRLGFDLVLGDVDFHVKRRSDAAAERLGLIAFEKEVVVQRRVAGEPGIGEDAAVDDVEMGVEDAWQGHRIRLAGQKRRAHN